MKVLECKKLNIGYSDKSVCRDITFAVDSGEYLCIMGENGSGKSTLVKTILGLNKPLSGKYSFDKSITKSDIGYLPQQSDFQKDFPATVREVIMSGFVSKMGFRPFYNKIEKKIAKDVVEYLGITDYLKRSYKDLSGGQQQRVFLARALVSAQNILIMDEPTNGLDAKSIRRFYELIKDLNDKGMTIIMVSHNIDKVVEYATHVIYLKDILIFSGTKDEFVASELCNTYLGKGEKK